jgi:hypothetical protein
MMYRVFPMAALALALFVCAPALAAAKDADVSTHDGKVVSTSGDDLVMTGKDGKEHTHTLTANGKVTCDGKVCTLKDLKAGMKVRVTTKADDIKAATKVEALDKNNAFVSSHDGKVSSITGDELVMTGKDGKKHTHALAKDAKVTCDGKVCKLTDLKEGMKIRVTTNDDDKKAVVKIEAIDKSDDFEKREE